MVSCRARLARPLFRASLARVSPWWFSLGLVSTQAVKPQFFWFARVRRSLRLTLRYIVHAATFATHPRHACQQIWEFWRESELWRESNRSGSGNYACTVPSYFEVLSIVPTYNWYVITRVVRNLVPTYIYPDIWIHLNVLYCIHMWNNGLLNKLIYIYIYNPSLYIYIYRYISQT